VTEDDVVVELVLAGSLAAAREGIFSALTADEASCAAAADDDEDMTAAAAACDGGCADAAAKLSIAPGAATAESAGSGQSRSRF
jgi:hypothetical protein